MQSSKLDDSIPLRLRDVSVFVPKRSPVGLKRSKQARQESGEGRLGEHVPNLHIGTGIHPDLVTFSMDDRDRTSAVGKRSLGIPSNFTVSNQGTLNLIDLENGCWSTLSLEKE